VLRTLGDQDLGDAIGSANARALLEQDMRV
jgi:hypothetical protein